MSFDIATIPRDRIPALIAALAARLLEPAPEPEAEADDDVWLDAKQVAAELRCSVKFVYRHAPQWSFAKRLGTRSYRFSQAGLRRWQARRRA